MNVKKAFRVIAGAGMGTLLAIVFLSLILGLWPRANSWNESIDIAAGRYRYQRFLLWFQVADRIEETPLSLWYRGLVGEPPEPVWRLVNTFSPVTHHSPHYRHHGSLTAASYLEMALRVPNFTDEARIVAIKTFFRRLQLDDDEFGVSRYASRVLELATEAEKQNRPIRPADLPQDEPADQNRRLCP